MRFFSFIIPLYNRPDELEELLTSFTHLERVPEVNYEIIVVEDGSTQTSAHVVEQYRSALPLKYLTQSNQGPSGARNHGAKVAEGEWLIFLDSDTILPPGYLRAVAKEMQQREVDLWGGPDRAREDFTVVQKAIDYSMTSFLTTGGIRGGSKERSVDKYYPRTFNMGVRRSAFERVGGFRQDMRYGEDLDFSMRVIESGGTSALYSTAWLYHKRRVSYQEFYRQINHSGKARVVLNDLHPGSMRWVHFLPVLFILYHVIMLFTFPAGTHILPLIYILLILIDVFLREGNMEVAFNAVAATYVQFFGYGLGVLEGLWSKWNKQKK